MSNTLERLFSPGLFDIIFPFFAFIFVVLLPSFFGIYVIFRVIKGKYENESSDTPSSKGVG